MEFAFLSAGRLVCSDVILYSTPFFQHMFAVKFKVNFFLMLQPIFLGACGRVLARVGRTWNPSLDLLSDEMPRGAAWGPLYDLVSGFFIERVRRSGESLPTACR